MPALMTSYEIAMRDGLITDQHPIPPITDPMGKHWDQPQRSEIEVDDTYALMSAKTMEMLADYTQSQPTGVYPGKMWRALYKRLDIECPHCKRSEYLNTRWAENRLWIEAYCRFCTCHWMEKPAWFLKWFGAEFDDPRDGKCVSNNVRQILIA